jgi:hypothetical protein
LIGADQDFPRREMSLHNLMTTPGNLLLLKVWGTFYRFRME